jgi:hypothetical protein
MADPLPLSPASPIVPAEGVTAAERYLAKRCKRSFLSLWSYPGVFRDQKAAPGGKGDGKELCDLLVVFENHIIIFSDKNCRFGDVGKLQVQWPRWFKRAVKNSAEQAWGAERWIRQFPNRLFLDRRCTIPFPINLPDPAKAIFHRIVVAHDAARACKEKLGGSGSLMLDTSVVGDGHLNTPFTIGQINPTKGYVHVFDDTTLSIVMSTLDTITDFTAYLTKKERLLTGNKVVWAAGEDELLGLYLRKLNRAGEHDFVFDEDYNFYIFEEGFWKAFANSPERHAQIESNRISYSWDKLIEKFAFNAMSGTQYFTTGHPLREQEVVFRFLAREPRTHRRALAISLHQVLERSLNSSGPLEVRVIPPISPGSPHYVFLFLKRKAGVTDKQYRNVRMNLLANYCRVTKLKFPQATNVVGIASEAGLPPQRSEDFIYMDASRWSAKDEAKAKEIQNKFGLLREVRPGAMRQHEYPVDHAGRPRRTRSTSPSRNSPCPCGSHKRFKNCHGKELFNKKGRRRSGSNAGIAKSSGIGE